MGYSVQNIFKGKLGEGAGVDAYLRVFGYSNKYGKLLFYIIDIEFLKKG